MRLIDGDALKRRAQKVATEAWKMKIKAEVETILNQFIDWINEAPTIEVEQHWVLMSEKMPEEHEWLGTKRFGTTKSDEVYVTFESPNGERFCQHLSFQNGGLSAYDQSIIDALYKGSKPVAWMPLPEPARR